MNESNITTSTCKGCGTTISAVDEQTHEKMFAEHILREHSDEASESVLEEAREVVEGGDEQ